MAPTGISQSDLTNAVTELKLSIGKSSSKTFWGQVLLAAFTAVFTSIFGVVAFKQQANITATNETHLKEIASHLTLAEEFFRRKLNVYEKLIDNVTSLERACADAEYHSDSATKQVAMESGSTLNRTYTSNDLYIGRQTLKLLEQIFAMHTRLPALSAGAKYAGRTNIEELRTTVRTLRKQMSVDLHLADFGETQ